MRTPGTRTFTHRRKKAKNCAARNEKFLPVVIGYVITIGIGLALPPLAVALYFGLAVYLVLPFREVTRLLFRRS